MVTKQIVIVYITKLKKGTIMKTPKADRNE